jgi:hypothetical protein
MLIYKSDSDYYIYIHIPKNSGRHIRKKIYESGNYEIINSYWSVESDLDLAHIPYIKKNLYIDNNINYKYFTYMRRRIYHFFKNKYRFIFKFYKISYVLII